MNFQRMPGVHTRTVLLTTVLCLCLAAAYAQVPVIKENNTIKVDEGVYVIPDGRVNLVPNVGIILGERGILVVDTGMGPENAKRVLNEVRKLSDKPIRYLTITHFHPEHGMGAQAFPVETNIIYPKAQKEELFDKAQDYIKMFSGFSPEIAGLLKNVKLVSPQITYVREADIDLGDVPVQLLYFGPAHTRGDSFVYLTKQRILFTGDVVVNRFFPIMPDPDANGNNWIRMLDELDKLHPAKVVPGHGAIGDASLIGTMRDYLVGLRSQVLAQKAQGLPVDKIEADLVPKVRAEYKDWDNPEWIKNAIENFYNAPTAQ